MVECKDKPGSYLIPVEQVHGSSARRLHSCPYWCSERHVFINVRLSAVPCTSFSLLRQERDPSIQLFPFGDSLLFVLPRKSCCFAAGAMSKIPRISYASLHPVLLLCQHTSCVSEEQKYQGALFKAPKVRQSFSTEGFVTTLAQ